MVKTRVSTRTRAIVAAGAAVVLIGAFAYAIVALTTNLTAACGDLTATVTVYPKIFQGNQSPLGTVLVKNPNANSLCKATLKSMRITVTSNVSPATVSRSIRIYRGTTLTSPVSSLGLSVFPRDLLFNFPTTGAVQTIAAGASATYTIALDTTGTLTATTVAGFSLYAQGISWTDANTTPIAHASPTTVAYAAAPFGGSPIVPCSPLTVTTNAGTATQPQQKDAQLAGVVINNPNAVGTDCTAWVSSVTVGLTASPNLLVPRTVALLPNQTTRWEATMSGGSSVTIPVPLNGLTIAPGKSGGFVVAVDTTTSDTTTRSYTVSIPANGITWVSSYPKAVTVTSPTAAVAAAPVAVTPPATCGDLQVTTKYDPYTGYSDAGYPTGKKLNTFTVKNPNTDPACQASIDSFSILSQVDQDRVGKKLTLTSGTWANAVALTQTSASISFPVNGALSLAPGKSVDVDLSFDQAGVHGGEIEAFQLNAKGIAWTDANTTKTAHQSPAKGVPIYMRGVDKPPCSDLTVTADPASPTTVSSVPTGKLFSFVVAYAASDDALCDAAVTGIKFRMTSAQFQSGSSYPVNLAVRRADANYWDASWKASVTVPGEFTIPIPSGQLALTPGKSTRLELWIDSSAGILPIAVTVDGGIPIWKDYKGFPHQANQFAYPASKTITGVQATQACQPLTLEQVPVPVPPVGTPKSELTHAEVLHFRMTNGNAAGSGCDLLPKTLIMTVGASPTPTTWPAKFSVYQGVSAPTLIGSVGSLATLVQTDTRGAIVPLSSVASIAPGTTKEYVVRADISGLATGYTSIDLRVPSYAASFYAGGADPGISYKDAAGATYAYTNGAQGAAYIVPGP